MNIGQTVLMIITLIVVPGSIPAVIAYFIWKNFRQGNKRNVD